MPDHTGKKKARTKKGLKEREDLASAKTKKKKAVRKRMSGRVG